MLRTKNEVDSYNERNKLKGKKKAVMWDIVPLEDGEITQPLNGWFGKRWFCYLCDKYLGTQWIGLWPWYQVYWYRLRCSMIEINEQGETGEIRKDSQSCFVYLNKTTYYSKVRCVTHKEENINLTIEYFFSLACRNPYVSLFGNDEWFINLTAMTDAKAVRFAANLKYEEINVDRDPGTTKDEDVFAEQMLAIKEEIRRESGFIFNHPVIFKKLPGDDEAKKFVEAIAKEKIAEREGAAKVTEAEKRALATAEDAKGDAAHYGAKTTATTNLINAVSKGVKDTSSELENKSIQAALASAIIPMATVFAGQMITKQPNRQEGDE
jgi:hypothetical protein